MPFTPSHAAAALPFLRTPLPVSALVAGTVAPDLPFYLPFALPWPTHTATAVVTTDVLIGLAAWALWHGLLAAPAVRAAPAALRARVAGVPVGLRSRLASPSRGAWTLLALAVGAATHVLWDEFTHARRWGPETFPVLAEQWGAMPGYRWLQYATSVLGGLVLLAWAVRWWRRTPARTTPPPGRRWPWVLLGTVGVVVGAVAAVPAGDLGEAIYDAATWGGGTALAAAAVLAAVWQVRHRTR
ncbi:DUF4184 family protein [Blastococcus sp. TML/M2B]|uniref:DUF4184 family protein n=1 Tax=unclassified Blastococcus TaxID=2619396 RepID=UPI00190D481F|nr:MULTISPECIES: DUF4184 family protein [unclassified Blastococcus]MBN1094116.1 DUF4184 family protein [Blastococcus sp. TML/M2B]MBN1095763.1 DUF4184 family protein [Blastococcus sp. TML/C7B]